MPRLNNACVGPSHAHYLSHHFGHLHLLPHATEHPSGSDGHDESVSARLVQEKLRDSASDHHRLHLAVCLRNCSHRAFSSGSRISRTTLRHVAAFRAHEPDWLILARPNLFTPDALPERKRDEFEGFGAVCDSCGRSCYHFDEQEFGGSRLHGPQKHFARIGHEKVCAGINRRKSAFVHATRQK